MCGFGVKNVYAQLRPEGVSLSASITSLGAKEVRAASDFVSAPAPTT